MAGNEQIQGRFKFLFTKTINQSMIAYDLFVYQIEISLSTCTWPWTQTTRSTNWSMKKQGCVRSNCSNSISNALMPSQAATIKVMEKMELKVPDQTPTYLQLLHSQHHSSNETHLQTIAKLVQLLWLTTHIVRYFRIIKEETPQQMAQMRPTLLLKRLQQELKVPTNKQAIQQARLSQQACHQPK